MEAVENQMTARSVQRGGIGDSAQSRSRSVWTLARTSIARQRELLPEIQRGGEFLDGCLARVNLRRIRWRREPSRQHGLSRPGSRQRQQFEQGAPAEQIQVVRVDVTIVAEALPGSPVPIQRSSSLARPRS